MRTFTSVEMLRGIIVAWLCYLVLHIPATILVLGFPWWPGDPSSPASVGDWLIVLASLILAAPASTIFALLGFFPAVLIGRLLSRVTTPVVHLLAYTLLGFVLGAIGATLAYVILFLPVIPVYGIIIWPQLILGYGAVGALAAALGATITVLRQRRSSAERT